MCLTDCNNILMRRHWQSIQNSCSIDWVANYYARNKNHFCMQDIKLGFYAGRKAVCSTAGTYRGKGRNRHHKNVPRIEAKPAQKIWYWMNNNIRTVLSESSTFASLSFDQGLPKNARLQHHLANRNAIWRDLDWTNCCLFCQLNVPPKC